jgi:hypothetical protein
MLPMLLMTISDAPTAANKTKPSIHADGVFANSVAVSSGGVEGFDCAEGCCSGTEYARNAGAGGSVADAGRRGVVSPGWPAAASIGVAP